MCVALDPATNGSSADTCVSCHLPGVSAIPSAPVSLMMDDGPFFRMAAPGFSAPVPPLVGLPPTVAGTSFWLNEIILLTALSVLDATRPTYADFEFRAAAFL
jgi:hypothetical protein